ncbi:nucleoside-diphosphate-sugar epimerase [Methylobacterium sp. PvP062]|nr:MULTISPECIES: hypothetical protein [unclassified Methylobacterium]MBE7196790.1 hypothetical protein [Parafilimonas terrae]PVY88581.1 hypothetical protein C7388_14238 [Methylobacterium organophilum]GJE48237.1 hypothetical protein GOFOIKOB_1264 [Methylobacterium tardum]MBP2498047.1 nucleoside-diphosphate-sugar epimerase [Methylobacterium sp. PvP105]MWV20692.1 hypothetical protein [Methylobacterium sp. 2A]
MDHAHLALVRAYDGEPLKRVILATGPDVLYVANPRFLDAIRTGRSQPIGFRPVDCYAWDEIAFERLSEAYAASGQTETDAWIALPPFAGSHLRLR